MSARNVFGDPCGKSKRTKREPETFQEAIQPGRFCIFLLGSGALEYPVGYYWTKLSLFYSLIFYASFTYTSISMWPFVEDFNRYHEQKFNTSIFSIIVYINMIELYLTPILGWARFVRGRSLLERIGISEKCFTKLKLKKEYKCLYNRQLLFIGSILLFETFLIIARLVGPLFTKYSFGTKIFMGIGMVITHSVSTLSYSCYIILISFLGDRLHQLRGLLKKMRKKNNAPYHIDRIKEINRVTDIDIEISKNHDSPNIDELISDIRQAYSEMVGISNMTNSVFGPQIISTLVFSYTSCAGLLYLIWAIIFWSHAEMSAMREEIELLLGWLFSNAFKLIIISCVCGNTANRAKSIGDVVCQLHEPSTSPKLRSELTNFTFQLVQNKLIFEPLGIVLNYSTLAMIVSTMSSLLVFLIQVRDIPALPSIINGTTWAELEDKLHLP